MVLRQVVGAVALIFVLGASQSHADFRVCNKSAERVNVAIGYNSKEYGWTSEGWWGIAPGGCHDIITGRLANRYYYVYAIDDKDGVWEAEKSQEGGFFCIAKAKFTLHNREFETNRVLDCEKGDQVTKQFLSVDTKDADNFTYNLTE